MNSLKSKACEGFLFYLNHDKLVYLQFLAKMQHLTFVSVAVKKEHNQNVIASCFVLLVQQL